MLSSISIIEVDLDGAIKYTPQCISPAGMPNKSGTNTLKHPASSSLVLQYQDDGAQLIIDVAATAVEKLRSLPAGQKESFASGFVNLTSKLHSRTDEFMASRPECLGGGTFDCQLPSPEGSEYEGSAINCVRCFSNNKDNYKLY
jgi:hypothetical protein